MSKARQGTRKRVAPQKYAFLWRLMADAVIRTLFRLFVSRRNLLQSLAASLAAPPVPSEDSTIRDAFYARLSTQPWMDAAASINAIVADGVLHLCGFAPKGVRRQALIVLAETVPGVRAVEDHLAQPREYDPLDRPNWPTAMRP